MTSYTTRLNNDKTFPLSNNKALYKMGGVRSCHLTGFLSFFSLVMSLVMGGN